VYVVCVLCICKLCVCVLYVVCVLCICKLCVCCVRLCVCLCKLCVLCIPYSLDQTPLSISRHSRIVATPLDVLNEIVAALEYYPRLIYWSSVPKQTS